MNFFEGQDLARRNTKLLVVMYMLAVAGVIVAVDFVLASSWILALSDSIGAIVLGDTPLHLQMTQLGIRV